MKFRAFRTDKYNYELFRPRPWKLFIVNYQDMNVSKRIRFTISSITGDIIYYMRNPAGDYLGYCLLEKKNWRYPFLNKNDYIISPYVIKPEKRNCGLGTVLLKDISNECRDYCNINLYAMVKRSNIPSMNAMKNAGFSILGGAEIKGFRRIYFPSDKEDSEYLILGCNK